MFRLPDSTQSIRFQSVAFGALLLFSTGAVSHAQNRPDPTPPRRVTGIPASVPLLMLGTAPAQLPVVEVFLNGKGPFRFGIETGANFLVIRPQLADSLSLRRVNSNDGERAFIADTLRIGTARFEGVRLEGLTTAARDVDGVLGLPLYAGLLLTIDYPAKVARFEQGALPLANGRDILPLTRTADFWSVPISMAGKPFQAVIDTRSTGAFGVVPEEAKSLNFESEPVVIGVARGAAIAETEVKMGRLAGDIRMGAYTFSTPDVGIRALPPGFPNEPLLGTIVLQQFAMTLDQKNARVRLSRAGDNTINLPRRAAPPARTSGAAAGPTELVQLTGTYGDRSITLTGDTLYVQRPNGQRLALIPTAKDAYTLREVPTAKLEFTRDANGRGVKLRVFNRDGQWETVERTPPS